MVGRSLNNGALLALASNDLTSAVQNWRRGTEILQHRAERGLALVPAEDSSKGEAHSNSGYFAGLVKTTHRLVADGSADPNQSASKMFETAQWGQASDAAASLAQMAVRAAAGSPESAALVRERQDLVFQEQALFKLLTGARGQAASQRSPESGKQWSDRLAEINTRLAAIDTRIATAFEGYATLTSPKPATVVEIQEKGKELLGDNETLILVLDTDDRFNPLPEETFVWVVTKRDVRWIRSELGTKALQEHVDVLRCGLDRQGEWWWNAEKGRWVSRTRTCKTLRPDGLAVGDPLPFDTARAHAIYDGLFREVKDLLVNPDGSGKNLIVVPSGPLTQLPFHVLLTSPFDAAGALENAPWLIKRHAVTILPAVSSLKALRRDAKPSVAKRPFLGFGDPVLAGDSTCKNINVPSTCPDEGINVAGLESDGTPRSGNQSEVSRYFRNGLADVTAVASLCPLPDTAHELKCVAKSLRSPAESIVLGTEMTESAVKKAQLNNYKVIHFATHGLVAGETAKLAKGRAEPALVMTPPATATEDDDGLLTASEVAGLKLDADWVVMSACNTASGSSNSAEPLSGLARAFFYAGARALLVTHWPVNSNAATLLTSTTFAEMGSSPDIGRDEAFRRAMLSVMRDRPLKHASHPSLWAAFTLVGEGGALSR